MDKIYKSILNERIQQYGISTLTDQEALNALTGIALSVINTALETYRLPELIKYSSFLNLTKTQSKKLRLLYPLTKRIRPSNFKEKQCLMVPAQQVNILSKNFSF